MTGYLYKWSRRKSTDFSTSLRIKPCCHSFILILPFLHFVSNAAQCQPWPFNGQFWNSVGYLSLNLQPPWNRWLSLHLPSFCIPGFCFQCLQLQALASQWVILEQRGLLVWFPSAATIKWLASTFQPTMKLVIEPASAILLHSLMPALAFQWAILE